MDCFYVNDEPESKLLYTETIKLYCIALYICLAVYMSAPFCTLCMHKLCMYICVCLPLLELVY